MTKLYSRTVLDALFKSYKLRDINHYSKLYRTNQTNNIYRSYRLRFLAKRSLTREFYDNCGKYHKHCIMADGREGFSFPSIIFEEVSDKLLLWSNYYKRSLSSSILKQCIEPKQENIIKLLNISSEFTTNFDIIISKYWVLTFDIKNVFDLVFKEKQPLIPFINVLGNQNGTRFSTYSTIVYRWNDMNSYALDKFIKEYQENYVPFTDTTHIEYFFNCMTQLLQEAFLYYRTIDTEDVWSEVYRLSWVPELETSFTLYDKYLEIYDKILLESKYPDGIEPKCSLEII